MASLPPLQQISTLSAGATEANQLINIAIDLHRSLKANMSKDERFYRLEKPKTYTDSKSVVIPTARSAVSFITNALTQEMPSVAMHPRSEEDKALEDAEDLSTFLESCWYYFQSGRKRSVIRDVVWHGLVRGAMIFRVLLDKDLINSKPKQPQKPEKIDPEVLMTLTADEREEYYDSLDKYEEENKKYTSSISSWNKKSENKFPIIVQARDPLYVMWDNVEAPEFVVEVYPRKYYEVDRIYGKKLKDRFQPQLNSSTGANQDVWFCEIWKEDKYWYGISSNQTGPFVEVQGWKKHDYGFIPYVIQGAYSTPLPNVEDQFESLFTGHHEMLEYEFRLFNQLAEYIRKIALANIVARVNDPTEVLKATTTGSVIHILPDEDVSFLEPHGGTAQIIQTMLDTVQSYLTRFLLQPEVLQGRTRSRSGYGTQIQAQLAAQTLLPFTTGLSIALQQVNELILRMVEMLPGKISAWGPYSEYGAAYATKDMVRGFYRNDVEIDIKLPSEEGQISQIYTGLVKEGIVSKLYARKKIGIKNPRREERRILVEKAMSHPMIEEGLAFDMVTELNIQLPEHIKKAVEEMAKGSKPNQPNQKPPGGPPGAGGPPQGPPGMPPGLPPSGMPGPGQSQAPGPGSPQEMAMLQNQNAQINPGAMQ